MFSYLLRGMMNLQNRLQWHPKPHKQRIRTAKVDSNNNISFIAFFLSTFLNTLYEVFRKICPSWISYWIRWCPSSEQTLETAEKEVLSCLQREYSVSYVNIGPCWEKEDNFIWTLKMKPERMSEKTPLVLLHGFGSGIGFWVSNLDSLSSNRPVYAFDLLGFGRSSRPCFSTDESEAEQQFVTGVEMWRKAVGLNKMILLGHSIGGFLATSYAISHPKHVELLILVDPWGFPERPISFQHKYIMPLWVKFISTFMYGFNLLAALRASGPLGPYLVDRFRRDLPKKFSKRLKNKNSITRYIFHCNAQTPSGEIGFKAMADESGWAKFPMICRMNQLYYKIPIIFIYGSRCSDRQPALQIKYSRLDSYVDVQIIEYAGHHVYADQPEQFNALVNRICERLESSELKNEL